MGVSNFDCVAIGKTVGNNVMAPAVGYALVVQSMTIARDATLTQSATMNLPSYSTVVGFDVFVDTAYDSATSATLTVGVSVATTTIASGLSTAFITSMNAKTAGYSVGVHSNSNTTNMANVGTVTGGTGVVPVIGTITSVGQPTVGSIRVICYYLVPTT